MLKTKPKTTKKTRKTNPVPRLPLTRGMRTYTTQSGWLKAVSRINPKAQIKSHAGTMTAVGIGVWSGTEGVILPSIDRVKIGGRGHGGSVTRRRVVKKGAPRHGPVRKRVAAKRKKNPANSPALGMSKKAYVNRPSQAGKKSPTSRLKKRRGYAYLMAQRGFKGAFPNPRKRGSAQYKWLESVNGQAEKGVHAAPRGKITLPSNPTLAEMLAEMRQNHLLSSRATSASVSWTWVAGDILLFAKEDGYFLGILKGPRN